jgi:hypothetical protein
MRLPCNFCTHGNPEGSRFCNACGSPLNLTQCSSCEAINSVSAEECFQCGAPLSQDTGELATSPLALTETVQSSESAPAKGDRVPVAFAESLEARSVHSHVASHEPEATGDDQPSLAAALTADPASHDDDRALSPPHVGRATYSGRNPSHVVGLLVVVFVAIAGAAIGASYWISVKSTQPPDPRTVMDGARTAAPEPAPLRHRRLPIPQPGRRLQIPHQPPFWYLQMQDHRSRPPQWESRYHRGRNRGSQLRALRNRQLRLRQVRT